MGLKILIYIKNKNETHSNSILMPTFRKFEYFLLLELDNIGALDTKGFELGPKRTSIFFYKTQ